MIYLVYFYLTQKPEVRESQAEIRLIPTFEANFDFIN